MQCPECNGLGEIVEPSVSTMITSRRGKLERGWKRTWLINMLARAEVPHAELARALGVVPSAIQAFKNRHMNEIVDKRKDMEDQFIGMWIADKVHRLSEMQQDVTDINEMIEGKLDAATPAPFNPLDPANDGASTPSATDDLPSWFRVKTAILRAAAEELGQIPQKVQVQVGASIVTYKIDGVDLDRI